MGDVSSEPTMEEILSSIKRVIEESEVAPTAARARRPAARPNEPRDMGPADEVLELSERAPFPTADQLPRQSPRVEHALRADREPAPTQRPESIRPESARTESIRPEAILSADAAEASRGPLEALSRMIVKPDVAGADTLEGMVREMLRPMLREWIDATLPNMVEDMVAREIAKIMNQQP